MSHLEEVIVTKELAQGYGYDNHRVPQRTSFGEDPSVVLRAHTLAADFELPVIPDYSLPPPEWEIRGEHVSVYAYLLMKDPATTAFIRAIAASEQRDQYWDSVVARLASPNPTLREICAAIMDVAQQAL